MSDLNNSVATKRPFPAVLNRQLYLMTVTVYLSWHGSENPDECDGEIQRSVVRITGIKEGRYILTNVDTGEHYHMTRSDFYSHCEPIIKDTRRVSKNILYTYHADDVYVIESRSRMSAKMTDSECIRTIPAGEICVVTAMYVQIATTTGKKIMVLTSDLVNTGRVITTTLQTKNEYDDEWVRAMLGQLIDSNPLSSLS